MAEEVTTAVKVAVAAMQQSLINRLAASVEEISKQQEDKLATAISRLEGRINRSREANETLISTMRDDRLRFQSDIRSTLNGPKILKSKQSDTTLQQSLVDLGIAEGSSSGGKMGGNPNLGVGGYAAVGSGAAGSGGGPGYGVGSGGGPGYGFGSGGGPGWGDGPMGGFGPGDGNGPGFAGQNRNFWRHKKLDLPLFDGNNPDGWNLRAERFFNFYGLSEEKVEDTVVALEGQALLWFQWEHRRQPIDRWEQLKNCCDGNFELSLLVHYMSNGWPIVKVAM
ncbi:uncharacterized protein LOC141689476 [Apium graveolens]|uniref:uncharacterized protein LOC141689476 n=1 Tax=Apium graveolens TaxID=4045 RepID=UPI003D79DB07